MAIPSIKIRKINPGEEQQVCNLVKRVFSDFVAPIYEADGVEKFLNYIDPAQISHRLSNNHFALIADKDGIFQGMIEIRDFKHISLLFVVGNVQRQGIAKLLLHEAVERCKIKIDLFEISVNSSPNAIEAYRKLGFKIDGQEQLRNGIRFIPMKLGIKTDNDI